ncbi:hypothetical protein ACQQ60_09980 [Corynebacterium diphtheriae]
MGNPNFSHVPQLTVHNLSAKDIESADFLYALAARGKTLGSVWFGIVLFAGAALTTATAAYAAQKNNPQHPLVARTSKSAMWSFLATLVYDAEHCKDCKTLL